MSLECPLRMSLAMNVTVNIEMIAYIYNPYNQDIPATDTIRDSLTLKVEAPVVTRFVLADSSSPNTPASPLTFGFASNNPAAPTASGAGGFMGAMMTDPARTTKQFFGMWADVQNNTHYDLRMGFIQIVDSASGSTLYTKGPAQARASSDALDDLPSDTDYLYAPPVYLTSMTSGWLVDGKGYPALDSPSVVSNFTNGTGWLIDMQFHWQFSSSVVVDGGRLPGGGPAIGGYPVGLSTAKWHIDISATNVGNLNFPDAANVSSTTNMALWTYQLDIGAGPSASPGPGPNTPWTSTGDGKRKYMSWTTDMATTYLYNDTFKIKDIFPRERSLKRHRVNTITRVHHLHRGLHFVLNLIGKQSSDDSGDEV